MNNMENTNQDEEKIISNFKEQFKDEWQHFYEAYKNSGTPIHSKERKSTYYHSNILSTRNKNDK